MLVFFGLIKRVIYFVSSKLIIINIFFLKKNKKNKFIIYNKVSFGDTFSFCIENYHKIKNSNKKILTKSALELKIVKFFFPNKCLKLFFSIPMLIPFYSINNLLNNNQYFKKNIDKNYLIKDNKIKSSKKTRELIVNLIKSNSKRVSQSLKKFNKKKYILMHVKYYNTDINDLRFSYPRATSNIEKIFKTIEYLNKKKLL